MALALMGIVFKELYAVVIAAAAFGHAWAGKTVCIMSDSTGTVANISTRKSDEPDNLDLLRQLTYLEFHGHFVVTAKHIPGKSNTIADLISRNQHKRAREIAPWLNPHPNPIPNPIRKYEHQLQARFARRCAHN
jgi:hypothetical protein